MIDPPAGDDALPDRPRPRRTPRPRAGATSRRASCEGDHGQRTAGALGPDAALAAGTGRGTTAPPPATRAAAATTGAATPRTRPPDGDAGAPRATPPRRPSRRRAAAGRPAPDGPQRPRRRASACSSSSGASDCSSPSSCSLLAIGATKAAWLGVVKAGALKRAAVIQQEADIEIPARRGSITDVNGNDLAVSEPAVDIAATTYLIKDVTKAARELAPLIGAPEDALLRKLARSAPASSTSGAASRPPTPTRSQKLKIPGLEFIPRYKRDYPRDWTAVAAARQRRAPTTRASAGSSTRSTSSSPAPTASAGWSRTRWASRSRCATPSRSGPATTSA